MRLLFFTHLVTCLTTVGKALSPNTGTGSCVVLSKGCVLSQSSLYKPKQQVQTCPAMEHAGLQRKGRDTKASRDWLCYPLTGTTTKVPQKTMLSLGTEYGGPN